MSARVVTGRKYYERQAREQKRVRAVLDAYIAVARPIMLNTWRPDSCIAATRVTINVLQVFGLNARPFPVRMCVYNEAHRALAKQLGRLPTPEEQIADGEAWSIGLGAADDDTDPRLRPSSDGTTGYNGHLVALALDDALLIDASIDQASRPDRGMEIPAEVLAIGVEREFVQAGETIVGEAPCGAIVTYQRHPEPPSWEHAKDWIVNRHGLVELGIIRAMEAKGVRL